MALDEISENVSGLYSGDYGSGGSGDSHDRNDTHQMRNSEVWESVDQTQTVALRMFIEGIRPIIKNDIAKRGWIPQQFGYKTEDELLDSVLVEAGMELFQRWYSSGHFIFDFNGAAATISTYLSDYETEHKEIFKIDEKVREMIERAEPSLTVAETQKVRMNVWRLFYTGAIKGSEALYNSLLQLIPQAKLPKSERVA